MGLYCGCGCFPLGGRTVKQRIASLMVGGLLALALFGVSAAGPLEDGNAAHQRGDYATAVRLLRPLADKGNAVAQISIGDMSDKGEGVQQDYSKAVTWYGKAANKGNADAQVRLGMMYYSVETCRVCRKISQRRPRGSGKPPTREMRKRK